jgi:hypothetical protein
MIATASKDKRTALDRSRTVRHHCGAVGGGGVFLAYIAARPRRRVWSSEPRDALGHHHHNPGGLEQVVSVSLVNEKSQENHTRRNARLRRAWPLDLLRRLTVLTLDTDRR